MPVSPQTILTRSGSEITTPAMPHQVPCTDWGCRRDHEILRTGPVFASFHIETQASSHCACGCGAVVRRRFKLGHNSKLRLREGCSIDGCQLPHQARGYCATHLRRVYRHGDPLAGSKLATRTGYTLTSAGRRAVGLPPRYTEVAW